MNHLHVQIMNEAALSLAGSWEDERSAQEIVKDIRQSRSTKQDNEHPRVECGELGVPLSVSIVGPLAKQTTLHPG
jgi:hypothetical protein